MAENNQLIDEVQELVWALIDDVATEEQVRRLERLIIESEDARLTYIMCMQMHADLHFLFHKPPGLPPEVEKAVQAAKTKASAETNKVPLPLVNLPTGLPATTADGCV